MVEVQQPEAGSRDGTRPWYMWHPAPAKVWSPDTGYFCAGSGRSVPVVWPALEEFIEG